MATANLSEKRPPVKLALENLEDRCLATVFVGPHIEAFHIHHGFAFVGVVQSNYHVIEKFSLRTGEFVGIIQHAAKDRNFSIGEAKDPLGLTVVAPPRKEGWTIDGAAIRVLSFGRPVISENPSVWAELRIGDGAVLKMMPFMPCQCQPGHPGHGRRF